MGRRFVAAFLCHHCHAYTTTVLQRDVGGGHGSRSDGVGGVLYRDNGRALERRWMIGLGMEHKFIPLVAVRHCMYSCTRLSGCCALGQDDRFQVRGIRIWWISSCFNATLHVIVRRCTALYLARYLTTYYTCTATRHAWLSSPLVA